MKIFNKHITLLDFIPPLIVRILRKIKSILAKNILAKNAEECNDPNYNDFSGRGKKFIHKVFGSYDGYDHEDLLIDFLLDFKSHGYYVEIGANDPNEFPSHATRFYLKGWRGINIEPQLSPFNKLVEARPEDINLNIGIGPMLGKADFYMIEGFSNGSSFNNKMAENHLSGIKLPP